MTAKSDATKSCARHGSCGHYYANSGGAWSSPVRLSNLGSGAPYKTSAGFAFTYGYDKLRFVKPVFIGDTLRTRVTVKDKQDDPERPHSGRVIEACEVLNQRDEVVMYCEHILLVAKTSSGSDRP